MSVDEKRRSAQSEFPLPDQERHLLIANVIGSDIILLIVGAILAIGATWARSGDISWTVAGFGALSELVGSMRAMPEMIVAPLALAAASEALDHLLRPRSAAYRAEMRLIRHGVNGELPRLGVASLAALMVVVGFVEELVFRYGVLGIVLALLSRVAPSAAAAAVAVFASAALFALAHTRYRGLYSVSTVFVVGILLGAFYIQTGSLLACAVFHAIYDFCGLMLERWHMVHDDDYFDGDVPTDAIARMAEAKGRRRK